MSDQVFANGREVSCKAGDGKSICAFPDVCFSPPTPPPSGVPIPYPNTGSDSDVTEGSKTVKISRQEVLLRNKSYYKRSTGNEAATPALKKGVLTGKIQGKVYFTSWSMDVKIEGENVVRHLDMTTHNHGSQAGNTLPWLHKDEMALVPNHPCVKDLDKKKEACEDKKLITKQQQCDNPGCSAAKKCLLITHSQGKSTAKSSTLSCCEGEQPHHLVESHSFCDVGERGTALPQFSKPPYNPKKAPTVCAKGSRFTAEHGGFHALQGKAETKAFNANPNNNYAWNYGKAKKTGVSAHKKIFPASGCNKGCLEAQLDSYHSGVGENGVKDSTPLRTYDASKNMQEWQKESQKSILNTVQEHVGKMRSGF